MRIQTQGHNDTVSFITNQSWFYVLKGKKKQMKTKFIRDYFVI